MIIRTEIASDIKQITNIHNLAFGGVEEGIIIEKLRINNNLTLSLVSDNDEKFSGHIAYSPVKNKLNEVIGIGLGPVGVLPILQNQGIGSELIKTGHKLIFDMGFEKIFVLGDPKYYTRFGFDLAKRFNIFCEFDPEGQHFMLMGKQRVEKSKTIVYYGKEFE